jgi:hypothetical protein
MPLFPKNAALEHAFRRRGQVSRQSGQRLPRRFRQIITTLDVAIAGLQCIRKDAGDQASGLHSLLPSWRDENIRRV